MLKKKIACMATVLALCGTFLVGAEYTILEKTEKVETTVYGNVQTGSLNDRIDNLDKSVNGQALSNGSIENRTDTLYNSVYGHTGDDLSMLAAVNMMQWKYSGKVTHDSLSDRVASLEESLNGKVSTGSLTSRVAALRSSLLGNEKFVSEAVTVPAGTIVKLKTAQALSSKTNKEGDTVNFNVLEDVLVGGVIAIPRGAECNGTITGARHATRFGRDGKLTVTFGNVFAANGTPVALTVGNKTKDEYKRLGMAAGASGVGALILGPVGLVGGLFVKGNDVELPAGSTMLAETKVNSDVVGFSHTGAVADTSAADAAASGVGVNTTTTTTADGIGTAADSTTGTQPATGNTQTTETMPVGNTQTKVTGVDLSKANDNSSPSAVVTISSNK